MMPGCSGMITPETGMIKTRFPRAMGMSYFRTIETRENRR